MQSTPKTTLIETKQSWFYFDIQGIWEYRDLILLLVKRDFIARYKQTVLGPLWFIIQPILMTFLFSFIFARVAKIPTDGIPSNLFYLCSLMIWNYFSQSFSNIAGSFIANAHIYQKVYFPRLIIPISLTLSNTFTLLLQLATFFAFFFYYQYAGAALSFHKSMLYFPLVYLHTLALALGVGLWMSALTAKYRDLSHLTQFIMQLWMYATPIIFPLSEVPASYKWIILLNPMSAIVETTKYLFLSAGGVTPLQY